MIIYKKIFCFAFFLFISGMIFYPLKSIAQQAHFTHADTLRGSITPWRAWWNVIYYNLHVAIHPADSTISGYNKMTYRVTGPQKDMQIDLQQPMQVDSMLQNGQKLSYTRDGNTFFVTIPKKLKRHSLHTISIYYHGKPIVAKKPPWQGGFIWTQDSLGHPWIATAVQGIGASVWWPDKDQLKDEPDSLTIHVTVPNPMVEISNGRLRKKNDNGNGTSTYTWHASNPINNYDVAIYAGDYVHFSSIYHGEKGPLDLSYWVLKQHLKLAKKQFKQVKPMLKCFEHWFGPYPFYKDSYKLVEAPYLGMENQSAIAYGNRFENGYYGQDLSGTGWGLKWDFIIIHESAHEWWGNSLTASDIADMWIHEGFASYAEGLYTECQYGKKAGEAYTRGTRKRVNEKRPVISHYGVHQEPPEDQYWKGANMLLTIREIINNDSTFRHILRGLQKKYRHQTVNTEEIKDYFIAHSGKNLEDVFVEYLHETSIPVFQYYIRGGRLHFRWKTALPYFEMPLKIHIKKKQKWTFIHPVSDRWKTVRLQLPSSKDFKVNKNFYIKTDSLTNIPVLKE
jgi:aminopeptidase N